MLKVTISDCLKEKALTTPEKEALVYKKTRLSFQELDAKVDALALGLRKLGMVKDDRVAIYLEKSHHEVISILATNRAGGVFVDINHQLKASQVEHILLDSGARFLLTTKQRLKHLLEVLPSCHSIEHIILHGAGETPEKLTIPFVEKEQLLATVACEKAAFTQIVETDIASIIYTSGSTGKPKGVVISHRNLLAGAESASSYLENTPEDRILCVLPFSFDAGLVQLTAGLYVGYTCVLINYLLPNDILKWMERENITGLAMIPPLWLQILQKSWDQEMFPHWRYLTNTGGAFPAVVIADLTTRLPRTKIYPMYGLTEAFRGTYLPPGEVIHRPTSMGKAMPNAEIWVINEKGEHCKPGEPGELVQRGAHVALGYWNDSVKTAEKFKPNPFSLPGAQIQEMVVYSGDRVKTDEEGYLYFVGRMDEMIKTSGYRVSPTEVEEALYADIRVRHTVAFGVQDEVLGQKIVAIVSPRDQQQLTIEELRQLCQVKLPNYMQPKVVEIWDNLPLNPNGKIDRKSVQSKYRDKLSKIGEKTDSQNFRRID